MMVLMDIKNKSQFRVTVIPEEGKAGELGKGGTAGKGGPGGPPGHIDLGRRCREATAGSSGRDSVGGKDGLPGKPGKFHFPCFADCQDF